MSDLLTRLRKQSELCQERYDAAMERLADSPNDPGLFEKYLGEVTDASRHHQQISQLVHWQEHMEKRLEEQKATQS